MQHESHLSSEAPRTPLAQAELADDDIGVGDGLGAVVADILLGDDDAHWASFIPMWKSHLDSTGALRIHPPACGTPPPVVRSWRRPSDRGLPVPARVRGDSPP